MLKDAKVVGGKKNFWVYSDRAGFDLTHPPTPNSPLLYLRIPLVTRAQSVTIDPTKTALVVSDIQNYFLPPLLYRPSNSVGLKIVDMLLKTVIPACRKASILVVWLS